MRKVKNVVELQEAIKRRAKHFTAFCDKQCKGDDAKAKEILKKYR